MNYLAHFHLAGEDPGFIIGALLGDFVKGPVNSASFTKKIQLKNLPPTTVQGIILHRKIDALFDSHPQVKKLVALLPAKSRRFNGIVLDLFFDYALSHNWQQYEKKTLSEFSSEVLHRLALHQNYFCPDSQAFCTRLIKHNLLENYHRQHVLNNIAARLGQRLGKQELITEALQSLWQNEQQYTDYFFRIYPEIRETIGDQRQAMQGTNR